MAATSSDSKKVLNGLNGRLRSFFSSSLFRLKMCCQKSSDCDRVEYRGTEKNLYREKMIFEPLSPVINHEQILYGLRYSTTAWRLEDGVAFHEELGYWLWDPAEKQVMRSFMVPRGVTIIAGGTVDVLAKTFLLRAQLGSSTYGICSNPFLDREFKTVGYDLKIQVHSAQLFSYEEDTKIEIKNKPGIFHHVDKNTMLKK